MMRSGLHQPPLWRLAPWWVLASAAVMLAYPFLISIFPDASTPAEHLAHGLAWILRSGIGGAAAWWASRRTDLPRGLRTGLIVWAVIGTISTGFRVVGVATTVLDLQPPPKQFEVVWTFGSYACTLVVYALMPMAAVSRRERTFVTLDIAISAGGFAVLLWLLVTEPLAGTSNGIPQLKVLVYGACQVLLLVGLSVLAWRILAVPSARAARLYVLGEATYLPVLLLSQYETTLVIAKSIADSVLYFGGVVPALFAAVAFRHDQLPVGPPDRAIVARFGVNPFALLTTVAIACVLTGKAMSGSVQSLVPLSILLTVVTLLLVIRTHLADRIRDADRDDVLRLEQEQHRHRLKTVGRLAGGVAHEFNNLLATVLGSAEIGLTSLAPTAPAREDFEVIRASAMTGAELTTRLMQFSGRNQFVPLVSTDLQTLVAREGAALQPRMPGAVVLRVMADGPINAAIVEPEIEQVVRELVQNGAAAITGSGQVLLSLQQVVLREPLETPFLPVPPGTYACLQVRDSGSGINPDELPNIFDPFFTKRPLHRGGGLGLASVFGIVAGHGGGITVDSVPGTGTVVCVYLPVVDPAGHERVPAVAKRDVAS